MTGDETPTGTRGARTDEHAGLDAQPEMVCRFRPDGTLLFVNAAYARARGTTPQGMIGRSFWEFIDEHDRATVRAMLDSLTPAAPEVRIENRFHTAAGERWMLWANQGLKFDARGRLLEAQSIGIDITERKRAEEVAARNAQRMGALYRLTDRLQHAASVDEIHRAALAAIAQALGCERAAILLFDGAGVMRFAASHGLSEHYRQAVEGHSPWDPEARDPQPFGIDDLVAADLPAELAAAIDAEGIRALAFVPLVSGTTLIGKFMVYYDAPHVFAEDELEAALTIGRQVAFGLQRLRAEGDRLEAASRLRRSEQELSDFFESAAIGLHWVGPDGVILRANQAELDMLGYAREEYVGRHIAEFHVDRPVIEGILTCLSRGETVRDCPARMRHKDGSIRDVLIHSSVLFENGEFVHTRCFTYDVTERKRSEAALIESERRMRLVADNLPALIGYVDRGHRYRFLNARYGEWFGIDHGTLAGVHMRDLLGEELYAVRIPYIERVLRGETVRFERVTRHHRLGERATDMAYVPHIGRDGEVEGFYVMGFDITERKRTEEALKETDRRKDEFIATLSHELRNPLAPLKSALHVLRLLGAGASAAAPVHAMMERQVDHLVRLVDDLLEMSRISRGTFELRQERVELATIVRNAIETSDPLIQRGRHRLELDLPREPVWLEGDPVRLAQILSNLLNNAAKYTPPDGRIVVRAGTQSGFAVIAVCDNGAGIAPEALPQIFEMFTRGEHAGEPGDSSLGIGLPLARKLAQMHGGSIEATSEGRSKGAQFVVRLPLSADQVAGAARVQAGASAPVAHRRVLVVDDNRDAAESLGMLLQALGAEVHVEHAGAPALEAVGSFEPTLVLLDIGMPGMDGYEVARRMRREYAQRSLELVALTGWGQEEDRRRARAAGFDHHLTKPADAGVLQRLLAAEPPAARPECLAEPGEALLESGRYDRKT